MRYPLDPFSNLAYPSVGFFVQLAMGPDLYRSGNPLAGEGMILDDNDLRIAIPLK
jgi:hypothetical protein